MTRPDLQVILTHEHTDFDALASLLGASLLYPEATPVLPRKLNRNVREFATLYHAYLPFVQPGDLPKGRIGKVILVDTRALSAPRALAENCEVLVIDHHSAPEDEEGQPMPPERPRGQRTTPASWTIIHEPVGANATMLIERIVEARVQLSPLHATLLALGIHEDTGSLTYGGTTQRDAAALAWLLDPEHGVNLDVVSRFLNHPLSEEQRALFQELIANSEFYDNAGLKVVIATARTAKMSEEISTVAARLRDFHEPDALFLLVAMDELVQIVARSTTDDMDVGAIMRGMGGGGHVRAAAAPVRGIPVKEIRTRILTGVTEQARAAVTVATIMSQGRPQTLAPTMTITEAANLMRRYGHEGFPVVEESAASAGAASGAHNGDSTSVTILGVLTRREADRAMDHGMGNATVARFMRAGSVTVTPEDSLASLRRAMSESGWGQVPVVSKAGELLGIVTRTDLIKTWDDQNPSAVRRNEVEQRLAKRLTPVQHALTQLVGKSADAMRYTLYVVGGFVRDLFIQPIGAPATAAGRDAALPAEFDIDIVIEGDAIALAQRMRDLYGGRVVPHRQFGTAKWLLRDKPTVHVAKLMADLGVEGTVTDLPAHLDFVTARTEFYTAPTVLPTVESSSIKLDLLRRDFTINTLAVCLNPSRWGELLDFFGGLRDIQQGIIRVLHSLSFVDDPTRILRAVRYEQRFNFRIGTRTLEHMEDALDLLEKVSPARIRHEIERTLQEEEPERILLRMDALLILQSLHPRLHADAWTARHFAAVRATWMHNAHSHLRGEPLERLYWATLVFRMEADTDEELTARLRLRRETQRLVRGLHKLRGKSDQIAQPNQPPSAIVALLDDHEPAAIALFALLSEDEQIRAYADQYFAQWRHIHHELDGNDLMALGLPRGQIYREVLWALRAARLDGEITTRAEEEAFVRQYARDAQTG